MILAVNLREDEATVRQFVAEHGLAISAGVTLYVAASNLSPEVQKERDVISGGAVFLAPPLGIDGESDLLFELWGLEFGEHARSTVGHLPRGIDELLTQAFRIVIAG